MTSSLHASTPALPNIETASFGQDVIAASMRQPVLVEFWSPTHGQVGEALAKGVKAAQGKVEAFRMNIESDSTVAAQIGVGSIPTVIAFIKGRPIDGFTGVLSEGEIMGFLERIAGPFPDDATTLLEEAAACVDANDAASATELYVKVLLQDDGNPTALSALAKLRLGFGDIEGAKGFLANIGPEHETHAGVSSARAAIATAAQANALGDDVASLERAVSQSPEDATARFNLAVAYNAKGQRTEAADHLLAILKQDRHWNDDAARAQLLQFFEAWGMMDPATLVGRRKLSAVLFS